MRGFEYRARKSGEIIKSVRENIFGMESTDSNKEDAFDEMIAQLKDKFSCPTTDRNDQFRILSVLPKSWSVNKIKEEFNAPLYMVKQMKSLVSEQGILCTVRARRGHGISETDKQTFTHFFLTVMKLADLCQERMILFQSFEMAEKNMFRSVS